MLQRNPDYFGITIIVFIHFFCLLYVHTKSLVLLHILSHIHLHPNLSRRASIFQSVERLGIEIGSYMRAIFSTSKMHG